MSWSIALRRSPKPGAFTAATESVPRILFTTSVASASPSMSSATISSGLPWRATCSSSGSRSFIELIFFSWSRMTGILEHHLHALGVGHEVGRQVAAVELHALDHVERRLHGLVLFHGDDAFLADLLHRLGEDAADGLVAVRRDRADLGDLLGVARRLGELAELLGHRARRPARCRASAPSGRGRRPPASRPRGRSPGRARWRWWCRRRRRRRSCEATSFTICAPMFSNLSSSSISLATVTPSLVTVGEPQLFSISTLRPRGPSVTRTALARRSTPRSMRSRASCA